MEDLPIIKWFKSTDERYKRLVELEKKACLSEEEEWLYEADLKYCRDKINQLKYAYECAYDAGVMIGRIQSTGIQLTNMQKARIMKAYDVWPEMILEDTGISIDEINQVEPFPEAGLTQGLPE